MNFATVATATPTQLRLHQERMARLARMRALPATPRVRLVAVTPTPPPAPPAPEPVKADDEWSLYRSPAPYDSWDCNRPPSLYFVPSEIIMQVCRSHEVSIDDLKGPRRGRHLVRARREAAYLLRHQFRLSWHRIGDLLCKDHHSIIDAYRAYVAEYFGEGA